MWMLVRLAEITEVDIGPKNVPLVASVRSVLSASATLFPTHMNASSG